MKKSIIVFIVATLFAGCSVQYSGWQNASFLDFRPYTSSGFFFSTDPYPGDYSPIGLMRIEVIPDRTLKGEVIPSGDELLRIAYDYAIEMGANGISNFDSSTESRTITIPDKRSSGVKFRDNSYAAQTSKGVVASCIILTGTLIKIDR